MHDHGSDVVIRRVQTLEANVTRACTCCGAPGQWMSADDAFQRQGWPGTTVSAMDERLGQPVGGTCPNCGAERAGDEALGEIWRRVT